MAGRSAQGMNPIGATRIKRVVLDRFEMCEDQEPAPIHVEDLRWADFEHIVLEGAEARLITDAEAEALDKRQSQDMVIDSTSRVE